MKQTVQKFFGTVSNKDPFADFMPSFLGEVGPSFHSFIHSLCNFFDTFSKGKPTCFLPTKVGVNFHPFSCTCCACKFATCPSPRQTPAESSPMFVFLGKSILKNCTMGSGEVPKCGKKTFGKKNKIAQLIILLEETPQKLALILLKKFCVRSGTF